MDTAAIGQALDMYKIKMSKYPSTGEGLSSLTNPPKGSPLLQEVPKAPWDQDYNYAYPGSHNDSGFDIWSNGPDGENGSGDDIGNWTAQ